jgi:nucleotide-binding universal stress UspA family protein
MMSESLKIVVPTDFSTASLAVLDWVKRLNDRGHAEVHCINVVQQPFVYMPVATGGTIASMPTIDELQHISEESLKTFVESHLFDLETLPVTKVLVGRPVEEITNYAQEIDAQMIVIATHGQSGLAHLILGSTAEGVVRAAKCPVLTVRS